MAPQFPSIEQFFEKQSSQSPKKRARSSSPSQGRDGFTEAEVDAFLHPPANQTWSPPNEYEEIDIAALIPGPKCVTFVGRAANFYDQGTPSKKPRAAKGCVKIIVKDDTGALTVRLQALRRPFMRSCDATTNARSRCRSGSGTQTRTTASASATSSQYGLHTSRTARQASLRHRARRSSRASFRNATGRATSWCMRIATKACSARRRWDTK